MDIRYGANPADVKRYTQRELRDEFLIRDLYRPDEVTAVYSHIDRMVVLGIMPVTERVPIDKGIDVWKNFGTAFFFERREAGFFNLGGPGRCVVDGAEYALGEKDCVYIARGAETVTFQSDDAARPARFYGVSAPAHRVCQTRLLTLKDAAKKPLGAVESANKRVINQFIHPDVLDTCQLSMGLTVLDPGSVWNTMPVHTHERRMEVYTYLDIPDGDVVFHMMGAPEETRHLVMQNGDAVISPSWSIHAGCGTGSYTFIWAMGGENQAFDDMDAVPTTALR
ncbi:MAG: 5-dehydro-4-deoxy-D-glucuronate isomerase [Oscillospiraceae bacterium]|jgi:4-deoxy-L-threo-5-hexosulose-uronate ketol-isomerase|nr:5-dehydro-4-deoxy-D-glucuronate isomerase [Oscillospiraceae bacterium]